MPQLMGFSEEIAASRAEAERYTKQFMDILNDPRNQMMFAPGMSLLRAPSAMMGAAKGMAGLVSGQRGSFNPGRWLRPSMEEGGFNIPTSVMKQQDKGMALIPQLWEQDVRAEYMFGRRLENDMAATMRDELHPQQRDAINRYVNLSFNDKVRVDSVTKGQGDLYDEIVKRKASTSGGVIPPYWVKPR